MNRDKPPDKIILAGGKEFRLYKELDELNQEEILAYPDFEKEPEYTDDGRPFAGATDSSCRQRKPITPGEPDSGDCGGCGWFFREAQFDIIGVCMCECRKRDHI